MLISNLVRKDKGLSKGFLEQFLGSVLDTKKQIINNQGQILLDYGFKKNTKFSYEALEDKIAEKLSESLKDSNSKIQAIESKERIVRHLMSKVGLFKVEKENVDN